MEKETKNQKLKRLFETHPKVDKFYMTTDGQAFFRNDHAENHASGLEDKTVTPVNRSLFEQVEKLVANKQAGGSKEPKTSNAPKEGTKGGAAKTEGSKKTAKSEAAGDAEKKEQQPGTGENAGEGKENESDNQPNQ